MLNLKIYYIQDFYIAICGTCHQTLSKTKRDDFYNSITHQQILSAGNQTPCPFCKSLFAIIDFNPPDPIVFVCHTCKKKFQPAYSVNLTTDVVFCSTRCFRKRNVNPKGWSETLSKTPNIERAKPRYKPNPTWRSGAILVGITTRRKHDRFYSD